MSDYAAQQASAPTIPRPGEATLEFYAARLLRWAEQVGGDWAGEMREMAVGLQRIATR